MRFVIALCAQGVIVPAAAVPAGSPTLARDQPLAVEERRCCQVAEWGAHGRTPLHGLFMYVCHDDHGGEAPVFKQMRHELKIPWPNDALHRCGRTHLRQFAGWFVLGLVAFGAEVQSSQSCTSVSDARYGSHLRWLPRPCCWRDS